MELYPDVGNFRGRSYLGYFLADCGAEDEDDFFCEEMGLGFFVAYGQKMKVSMRRSL